MNSIFVAKIIFKKGKDFRQNIFFEDSSYIFCRMIQEFIPERNEFNFICKDSIFPAKIIFKKEEDFRQTNFFEFLRDESLNIFKEKDRK